MKRSTLIAGLLLAVTLPAAAETTRFDHQSLLGIWKFEKKTLAANAEMYITLKDAGACTQMIKLKALGTTRWAAARCAWTTEKEELTMKIVDAPTLPDKVGETSKSRITSVTPTALSLVNQKKEEQTWSRVSAMPPEFTAEFDRAYSAPKDQAK